MRTYSDRRPLSVSGYIYLLGVAVYAFFRLPVILAGFGQSALPILDTGGMIVLLIGLNGLYLVQPNTARVLVFLGKYAGTDGREGLRWTVPFLVTRERVSLRLRNFESSKSKGNDAAGNPVEIAGVTVWRVVSPAAAVFGVDEVSSYVELQAETALRPLASAHPYTAMDDRLTLQRHPQEMADALRHSVQERMNDAGVEIVEARISHLAYSAEIAAAMLQRQQADALVEAREVIVDGAVSLVEHALSELAERDIVQLDATQKVALVSNLLLVLSGDQSVQPTIETAQPSG